MKKMTLLKFVTVVTTLVALQLALVNTSIAAPPANGDGWGGNSCYTVQAGDTLSDIGYRYNIAPFFIAMVNHISNPDWIYEGQVLCIPPVGPPFEHPAPGMGPGFPMPPMQPWPPIAVPYQGMAPEGQPEAIPYPNMDMGMNQPQFGPYPQMGMDQSQGMPFPQMGMNQPPQMGYPQMGMDQSQGMAFPQMGQPQPMPYSEMPQMGMMPPQQAPNYQSSTY